MNDPILVVIPCILAMLLVPVIIWFLTKSCVQEMVKAASVLNSDPCITVWIQKPIRQALLFLTIVFWIVFLPFYVVVTADFGVITLWFLFTPIAFVFDAVLFIQLESRGQWEYLSGEAPIPKVATIPAVRFCGVPKNRGRLGNCQ